MPRRFLSRRDRLETWVGDPHVARWEPWSLGAGPYVSSVRESEVPFTVLASEDDASLTGLDFDAASWKDVSALAMKYHVGEVALVPRMYFQRQDDGDLSPHRFWRAARQERRGCLLLQSWGTTYPVVAQAAVRQSRICGKHAVRLIFPQHGQLTADIRIASLAQWGEIQTSTGEHW